MFGLAISQAAEELGITETHLRRLLRALKGRGDKAVTHASRGRPSNRKIGEKSRQEAVTVLSQPVYRGFGPTLGAEYLAKKHKIRVSLEMVRQWMIEGKLWRARKQYVEKVHEWRPRRSRFGELVQWDTSDHDWLEGRGDEMLLINMIDDATIQWFARFVPSDSTVENMNVLERSMKKRGRPLAVYTDRATVLSHAESRRVNNDYTILFETEICQIARKDICAGLRGAVVRVGKRRDGSVAVRFRERYLSVEQCAQRPQVPVAKAARPKRSASPAGRKEWCRNFDLKKSPKIWQATENSVSGTRESL